MRKFLAYRGCQRIMDALVWQMVSFVSNTMNYQQQLDARGLACPMPLLKTKLALQQLAVDEVLWVIASDQGSWRDIPRYVELSVHQLVASDVVDGDYHFWLKKGA